MINTYKLGDEVVVTAYDNNTETVPERDGVVIAVDATIEYLIEYRDGTRGWVDSDDVGLYE